MNLMFKKIAGVTIMLWLSGYTAEVVIAGSSEVTSSIKGRPPVISAPSTRKVDTVDIHGIFAAPGKITSGDIITLFYDYFDADGDDDNTTVKWLYSLNGVDYAIPDVVNVLSSDQAPGRSMIQIPSVAVGASVIKAVIQVASITGDPHLGNVITLADISQPSIKVLSAAPAALMANMRGGIFLSSDNPHAGSGSQDYTMVGAPHLQVGETYLFRAWTDTNNNGHWDTTEDDITASLTHIQWKLNGNNAVAAGNTAPLILDKADIAGEMKDHYTVPVNSRSKSGSIAGDQGFNLMVEFN